MSEFWEIEREGGSADLGLLFLIFLKYCLVIILINAN